MSERLGTELESTGRRPQWGDTEDHLLRVVVDAPDREFFKILYRSKFVKKRIFLKSLNILDIAKLLKRRSGTERKHVD